MSLPIVECKDQIIQALLIHPVLIITGEPGCGKSTKLPQFCLDSRELAEKLHCRKTYIGITQPRRVAAITMAKRVSYERNCRLGTEVRYIIYR